MLDFKRKCLSDLYRDNGGELPHESQLEDKLADTPMEVIAVPARVVNEKVGHSDAPPTPEPDHTATITNFIRMIETDGYYPCGRPEMDWVCTAEDVDDVVERCEHTRAIGLAAADFAPHSALDATDDVTADNIEGCLHADDELLNESELEEDSDASPHFDFRVSQSPPSKRAKPSPEQPTPSSPESPCVVRNPRRRNLNYPVLESPEQSQLPEPGVLELSQLSGTFEDLEDIMADAAAAADAEASIGGVPYPSLDRLSASNPGIDAPTSRRGGYGEN
jgi:hypothetical protein